MKVSLIPCCFCCKLHMFKLIKQEIEEYKNTVWDLKEQVKKLRQTDYITSLKKRVHDLEADRNKMQKKITELEQLKKVSA